MTTDVMTNNVMRNQLMKTDLRMTDLLRIDLIGNGSNRTDLTKSDLIMTDAVMSGFLACEKLKRTGNASDKTDAPRMPDLDRFKANRQIIEINPNPLALPSFNRGCLDEMPLNEVVAKNSPCLMAADGGGSASLGDLTPNSKITVAGGSDYNWSGKIIVTDLSSTSPTTNTRTN